MYHKTTTRGHIFFPFRAENVKNVSPTHVPGIMLSEFNYNRSPLLGSFIT